MTVTAAAETLAPPRERVLVLLANRENQRLLAEQLAPQYAVVHEPAGDDVDLCIVDGVMLSRRWQELMRMRADAEPVFLPVLLATARGDVSLVTRDLWRVVDDVIIRPIEKAELRVRLDTLLRARRLSLQLRRMSSLYEHERHVAQRLQEAGLPARFPDVPGIAFSAFYRAGSDEALIGGDWYDVMRLGDGRILITVGDVSGSGLDAAVTMGAVRQVLRGVAQVHPDPGLMLEAADRALASEGTTRQVTAFVGVFDPVTRFLTFASAGHPAALLRDADGSITELSTHGLPLGVMRNSVHGVRSVALRDDSLLVAYTDGLTEATRDIADGERRLRRALASRPPTHDPALASTLYADITPVEPDDDVVILAMHAVPHAGPVDAIRRWSFDAADGDAARAVREEIIAVLRDGGASDEALFSVEIVFGELVGNVVRYAPGIADVVLDRSETAPVLHVLDRGPGFRVTPRLPYDDMSERGRGLFIINELVEQFHVVLRNDGGSHASAVLAVPAPSERRRGAR